MTQSVGFHENEDLLDPETRDRHRAIASLNEELEAVDWYDQRVKAAHDDELRAILAHNRDEEKEHASMVLEWLRRRDPKLDEHLRNYLFQQKSPIEREHELEGESEAAGAGDGSLGIGSLREETGR
ncbi:MAG: ferritin [Betaproteobacteria bacterium]|nr:ferritin [Betaproteobacteria bacterium]